MISMVIILFVHALLFGRTAGKGLDNGVALTPTMGWNPFNVFGCDTVESDYRAAAEALVNLNLSTVGYEFVNTDCGWQSNQRTDAAQITWNTTRIPSGMQALGEYIISLGLHFGLYGDAGYYSCDLAGGWEHWIGSFYYEQADAFMFEHYGATYLKYTNCFVVSDSDFVDFYPTIDEETLFRGMAAALNNTGRHIIYAIDEWGIQEPAHWTSNVANSWTISNNAGASFADLQRIINRVVPITNYSNPGGWNDLGLLQVGNQGLTETEWKLHFAFWAAAKSPLLISTDLTKISKETLAILNNKFLIGVNQDPLGESVRFVRRYTDDYDVWSGNLHDGSKVAVLLNWKNTSRPLTFNLSDVGLASASITDLWNGTTLGNVSSSHTETVDAHGALVYKLADGVAAAPYEFTTYSALASGNKLAGIASLREFQSNNWVASNISMNGTFTFTGIDGGTKGGTKLTRITYINGDYTFSNTNCSNCRRVDISVNGGKPVVAEMPISAISWDTLSAPYLLALSGFVPGTNNTIMFSNPTASAPDIFSIDVEK